MVEEGSHWFNRASLMLVKVVKIDRIGEEQTLHQIWVQCEGDSKAVYRRDPEFFVRDYVRNEPLTLEWMQSEGWAVDETNPQCVIWQFGPDDQVAWTPNTEPEDVPWSNGTFDVWDHDGKEHVFTLPWPETVNDLLRTLRYGVGVEFILNIHTWPDLSAQ